MSDLVVREWDRLQQNEFYDELRPEHNRLVSAYLAVVAERDTAISAAEEGSEIVAELKAQLAAMERDEATKLAEFRLDCMKDRDRTIDDLRAQVSAADAKYEADTETMSNALAALAGDRDAWLERTECLYAARDEGLKSLRPLREILATTSPLDLVIAMDDAIEALSREPEV